MKMQGTVQSAIVAMVVLLCSSPWADAYVGFTKPVNLKSVIPSLDPLTDGMECLSYDGLEMYVFSIRPGGQGECDLWVSRRASTDKDWGPLENLGPAVNSPKYDGDATISADGLELCFASNRSTTWPDIYVTTRATKNDPWGPAVSLGPTVNSPVGDGDCTPWLSADGLELYLVSWRSGGYGESDIYVARRATRSAPWIQPVNLGPVVNSPYAEFAPSLAPDGLFLIFSDVSGYPLRPGGYGASDLYMTSRTNTSAPWRAPVNLGRRMNSPDVEGGPRLSPDGRTLYFWTGHDADTWANWQAFIVPIVDLNGDGTVDGKDDAVLAVCLGRSDPLCDIGPFPWGDGVVDAKDQAVLAGYVGQDVSDSTLVAHWALDETTGPLALESVTGSYALATGGPVWQPTAGKIGGALQFDGKDDYLRSLAPVLDPAQGPFSVFLWVNGGAPGQVILSQANGTNWLLAQPETGFLMSDLKLHPLVNSVVAPVVITDGAWHRVGFVWDGANRFLYVDGVEAAKGPHNVLPRSTGVLYLGSSSTPAPGTSWQGLIDDVRVYSRVVRP
ncbi:MAG: hypothetical protein MUC88_12710 [Planctomycetes bacterium]|jgi:Tol biopolymer transport system component|nr:hypothetical protein [Planctomycetota bacterium]